eukprot:c8883_g1_i1.p1 GENE.c8883_g1_i1~~c8883_g1_i1.p1  ORF type:complete len:238 (-),score=88.76 c8883_g1_i1:35-712(-)
MAVKVTDVQVLENPTAFTSPFRFEISFEVLTPLENDLEWKLVYVGSAETNQYDQELDSIEVGPLQTGFMKFIFEADPPDVKKIPIKDLLEVTVILLTCSYRGKMFIRVGYYLHNEYTVDELKENPPPVPIPEQIQRTIMADHPRVTKWQISWDDPVQAQTQSDLESNSTGFQQQEQQSSISISSSSISNNLTEQEKKNSVQTEETVQTQNHSQKIQTIKEGNFIG